MRLSMLKSKSYTGLKDAHVCTRPGMQLLAEGESSDNEEPFAWRLLIIMSCLGGRSRVARSQSLSRQQQQKQKKQQQQKKQL